MEKSCLLIHFVSIARFISYQSQARRAGLIQSKMKDASSWRLFADQVVGLHVIRAGPAIAASHG
jgi:hypothetical protein